MISEKVKSLIEVVEELGYEIDHFEVAEAIECYAESHLDGWGSEYDGLDAEGVLYKLRTSHDLSIEVEKFEEEFNVPVSDEVYRVLEDAFNDEVVSQFDE